MLVDGEWVSDFNHLQGVDGEGGFVRTASTFRHWVTPDGAPGPTGEGGFEAEAGRYHLYVALICPWACRTLVVRKLKRLERAIDVTVVEPLLTKQCWRFGDFPGSQHDPLYGATYVHELYSRADPHFTGEVTVPVLWDKARETIVNNESADIIRMFNNGFGALASGEPDLYPEPWRAEIDDLNETMYRRLNNGVYRAGFATTQVAYEHALADVFSMLDELERKLSGRDYLVGDRLTECDIRAFVTLVRFDVVYHGLFKTNLRRIADYSNLSAYLKRLFEIPGVAETVNFDHIRQGYYSIKAINPTGIVPVGPIGRDLNAPSERA